VKIETFAGPRRLTLVADDLPAAQADREEEIKGPRTSAPPQALEGFLRKTGLSQDQLEDRDGVWFANVAAKGKPTAEIIAAMTEEIVRGFPWPKSMKWGTCALRWVRPLQRILCVFDGKTVEFEIEGIASGDLTEGHRFMGKPPPRSGGGGPPAALGRRGVEGASRAFAVSDFSSYRSGLADNFVILDAEDRKARIMEAANKQCADAGLELVEDIGLLDEVAGLAEWPVPILGDMDPAFLDLPDEVIRTSMRTHQKYFAVRDPKTGKLAPKFVVVANIEATDGGKAIAAGNARVLSARLNDARFFWNEDNKDGNFERWLKKLEGVTFHAKLGTMAERVERISALAREIAPLVGADPDVAAEAARLAKADLASEMVGEFPELQGVMGGYYAEAAKKRPQIANAIRDHYKPQGPGDSVPTEPVTVAVALADKLEMLASFFTIDEKPTGSKDPYALRRAALGVIRTVLATQARISMGTILGDALGHSWVLTWGRPVARKVDLELKEEDGDLSELEASELKELRSRDLQADPEGRGVDEDTAILGDILAFFADRLKVQLRDEGKRHDLVDAVFALGDDDLVRIVARVEALSAFLATDDGANLLAGYKRAANILKAEEKKGPLPTGEAKGLPGAPAEETALIAALKGAAPKVDAALKAETFEDAMTALAALRAPVDAFFDGVMVNSDVPAERDNRLRLLAQVRDLMGQVADFSQVAG
jgi:glycyl-tRNA synthetase beta chain